MKRSKTTPETVGERLRKAREKAGLSMEEVAKRTKMHPRIVAALEEDRPVERLSPVYVRSYLRMYARLVGLSESAVLQEYSDHQETPTAVAVEELPLMQAAARQSAEPAPPRESRVWQRPQLELPRWHPTPQQQRLMVTIPVIVVCVLGLAWLIKHHPMTLPHPKPAQRSAAPSRPSRAPAAPRARTAAAPAAKPAAPMATAPAITVPQGETLQLQVLAKERAWLRVIADGKVIFQNVLEKGRTEQWAAQNSLNLWLGNAGSVELMLNGRSLGTPGRRGEVLKDLQITHNGVQIKR